MTCHKITKVKSIGNILQLRGSHLPDIQDLVSQTSFHRVNHLNIEGRQGRGEEIILSTHSRNLLKCCMNLFIFSSKYGSLFSILIAFYKSKLSSEQNYSFFPRSLAPSQICYIIGLLNVISLSSSTFKHEGKFKPDPNNDTPSRMRNTATCISGLVLFDLLKPHDLLRL